MKPSYQDITDKLGPPVWWDDNGTPRYCEFHPSHAPCIYAREVVLYRIKCQECGTAFDVTMTGDIMGWKGDTLLGYIKDHKIAYGDPPNAPGCCAVGSTMNSEEVRVLQYWRMENFEWKEVVEMRDQPLD